MLSSASPWRYRRFPLHSVATRRREKDEEVIFVEVQVPGETQNMCLINHRSTFKLTMLTIQAANVDALLSGQLENWYG